MRSQSAWVLAACFLAILPRSAPAQSTVRACVDSSGAQSNGESGNYGAAISADGRFLAYASVATNLVPGDTNALRDIFVFDRLTRTTERVSVASSGVQSNGTCTHPALSADGRFVAFDSQATNLVAGGAGGNLRWNVYVHDRVAGTTELVSVDSAGVEGIQSSDYAALSADGRFVAFMSLASNLVAGDTNFVDDVFVHDRQTGITERVSVDSSGIQGDLPSQVPSISADGMRVAFQSAATNFVGGVSSMNVFMHDRTSGSTVLVSQAAGGVPGNAQSSAPSLSANGRFVAFWSIASNLDPSDTNTSPDVFVHDLQSGTMERVSLSSAGAQANAGSLGPAISGDGRFVCFLSYASNLVPNDTNGFEDIFVRDRFQAITERVSVDSGGVQSTDNSWVDMRSISADGRFVAFYSDATNLVQSDSNNTRDVFLRDRSSISSFCFGDGSAQACPCSNSGLAGRGCDNSASTGGAVLGSSGASALAGDTLVLTAAGELQSAPSIFLQGDASIPAANFGDGLRCVGGNLKRLYLHPASGGSVSAPLAGDAPVSVRSAALGDAFAAGATRFYQVYSRDPVQGFCPNPPGNSWNISSGIAVVWGP